MTELVGLAEIAKLADRPRQTVWHWTHYEDFPVPVSDLGSGRVWRLEEVKTWMRQSPVASYTTLVDATGSSTATTSFPSSESETS